MVFAARRHVDAGGVILYNSVIEIRLAVAEFPPRPPSGLEYCPNFLNTRIFSQILAGIVSNLNPKFRSQGETFIFTITFKVVTVISLGLTNF